MPTAGVIQVPPNSTGQKLDTSELTVGANTVERQNVALADPSTAAALAAVGNAFPAAGSYGLVTRNMPTNVTASGTLGALNAAVALAADGLAAAAYEIDTGTLVGTVVFEGTTDNTNWFALNGVHIDGTTFASETSFPSRGHIVPVAWAQVRVRVSVYTSGSSAARLVGSQSTSGVNTELPAPATVVIAGINQVAAPQVNALACGLSGSSIFPITAYYPLDATGAQLGMVSTSFPMAYSGANWDGVRTPKTFKVVAAVSITAGTGQTVWTPTTGKKFRVMGFTLSSTVASAIKFLDSATEIFRTPILAAAGVLAPVELGNGILSALANNLLKLDATVTTVVTGTIWGTEE